MLSGTTKRKELHGTSCIRALRGTWGEKLDGANFEAYKFEFSCNVEETYSGFVLLVESKLDDDVGNIEVDLYLIAKMVKAYVSSCGKVHLTADQVSYLAKVPLQFLHIWKGLIVILFFLFGTR